MSDANLNKSHKSIPITNRCMLTIAVTSLIIGVIVYFYAYIGMKNGIGIDRLNQSILSWMIDNRTDSLTVVAKIITSFADIFSVAVLVSLICISFIYIKREIWRPVLLIGALIISSISSLMLKILIMDSRPHQVNMVPSFETTYSFPSGHTITIAVFLLVLGYLFYSRNYNNTKFILWLIFAIFGTIIMALTRLYLGYHWLTDVTASIGLGLVVFSLVIYADYIYRNKFKI